MSDEDTEYLLGSRETITPHPPPKKKNLLNQICINFKNDPNGSKKHTEKSHAWLPICNSTICRS